VGPQPWAAGVFGSGSQQLGLAGDAALPEAAAAAAAAASEGLSSTASSTAIPLPTLAAVKAFISQQQQQGLLPPASVSAVSSNTSSINQPVASAGRASTPLAASPGHSSVSPLPAATMGVSSTSSPLSIGATPAAAAAATPTGRQGSLQPSVASDAALVSSPAARISAVPPSEDELERWNAGPPQEGLQRVFQRSDTRWTDVDYNAGSEGGDLEGGGLSADIVREASEAGAAAAAAARTASTGSAAGPVEGVPRPREEV
jgi:hypothetical protein